MNKNDHHNNSIKMNNDLQDIKENSIKGAAAGDDDGHIIDGGRTIITDKDMNLCEKWIESSEFDSNSNSIIEQSSIADDDNSSIYTLSVTTDSSSIYDDNLTNDFNDIKINNINGSQKYVEKRVIPLTSSTSTSMNGSGNNIEIIEQIFKNHNTIQSFGNIKVENSKNVHIGNITYVTGPIHIAYGNADGGTAEISSTIKSASHSSSESPPPPPPTPPQSPSQRNANTADEPAEESIDSGLFITQKEAGKRAYAPVLRTVRRNSWLAQPPVGPIAPIQKPVPYVIICHTATETAKTQAEMILMVRNIQCFHIESKKWCDIGYNFLIGGDGNVYEGRGWDNVASHTLGWNSRSIGIAFVGCFMNMEADRTSIESCKFLIEKGVKEGHIAADYKLIAHCQVLPTESPGKFLFDEIKTWSHWTPDIEF